MRFLKARVNRDKINSFHNNNNETRKLKVLFNRDFISMKLHISQMCMFKIVWKF